MKNVFVLCGLLASSVSAHIQMSKPYPIRSPLNKDAEKKDYSYTNPLSTSGSDFPCKGYAKDPFNATADYKQGETYEIKLQGSATHEGGSCQISLSYDKGESFHVIHSMLGGCPIDKSYNFKVPSEAPSGEALLAWTWFNKIGNREMYMNCAQVNIGNGGSQNRQLVSDAQANTQADSFDSLPPIFIANVDGPGGCETIAGEDVNFPKPGPSVEGSVEGKGYKCKGDADFLGGGGSSAKNNSASGNSRVMANSPMSSSILNHHAPSDSGAAKKRPTTFGTPPDWNRKDANANDNAGRPQGGPQGGPQGSPKGPPQGKGQGHCPPGSIICSPDGLTFSLCTAHGPPVFMGPVAAGTICHGGRIVHA